MSKMSVREVNKPVIQSKKTKQLSPMKEEAARKRNLVLHYLENSGPLTRCELLKLSQLKWSTLYYILDRLEGKGKVTRYPVKNRRGTPSVYWKIKTSMIVGQENEWKTSTSKRE